MRYFVYIIYSTKLDRFYIGQTEDIATRLKLHQQKEFKGSYTTMSDDWELFYELACISRTQAIQIERHIKQMKSRQYIRNLKKYPVKDIIANRVNIILNKKIK